MTSVQRRKVQASKKKEADTADAALKKEPAKESKSIVSTVLSLLFWAIILFFGASYLITESWTWGYRGKWTNINNYIPVRNQKSRM